MLTQQQFMLVYHLWKSNAVQTSKDLSHIFTISERTIKNEIAGIQAEAIDYGFSIEARRSVGYRFKVIDDALFNKEFLPKLASYSDGREIPNDHEKRIYQTMCLLFQDQYVTADILSTALFVDKRSVQKTLKSIRILLQNYHLTLLSKPNQGFKIVGNEFHKRICIMDIYAYFHHFPELIHMDQLYQNYFQIDVNKQLMIRGIWLQLMREQNHSMKDIHFEKFVYHLLLADHRFRQGYMISVSQTDIDQIQSWEAFQIILELISRLKTAKLLNLNLHEAYYLSIIYLCCMDIHNHELLEKYPYFYEESKRCVPIVLNCLYKLYPSFGPPEALIHNINYSLFPLVVRNHYKMVEDNKWMRLWRFKNIHSSLVSLELAFLSIQAVSTYAHYDYRSDDVVQFAYVFQSCFGEQEYPYKRQKILIIPSSGTASAQFIVNFLQRDYASCIESIDIREQYEIKDSHELEAYDVLISSPEYCASFSNHIRILYEEHVFNYNYKEIYYALVDAEKRKRDLLPDIQKEDFIDIKSAGSMLEIFSLIFPKEQAEEEFQAFQQREELIFNRSLSHTAGYFRFIHQKQKERFCVIRIEKPLKWKLAAIDTLILCFIHPDSFLKRCFYDNLLTRLLNDKEALDALLKSKNNSAVSFIMHQLR